MAFFTCKLYSAAMAASTRVRLYYHVIFRRKSETR